MIAIGTLLRRIVRFDYALVGQREAAGVSSQEPSDTRARRLMLRRHTSVEERGSSSRSTGGRYDSGRSALPVFGSSSRERCGVAATHAATADPATATAAAAKARR